MHTMTSSGEVAVPLVDIGAVCEDAVCIDEHPDPAGSAPAHGKVPMLLERHALYAVIAELQKQRDSGMLGTIFEMGGAEQLR